MMLLKSLNGVDDKLIQNLIDQFRFEWKLPLQLLLDAWHLIGCNFDDRYVISGCAVSLNICIVVFEYVLLL